MRASCLALLGTVCVHTLAHAQPRIPQAPRVDSADTYFGTRVPDPYRWLEHYDTPEVRRWYEAENAASDAVLNALPAREAFRRAFAAARRSRPYRVAAPREAGSRIFYTKRLPEEQTSALYVRERDGVERRLFAVAQVADSAAGPTTFGGYFPSPDGSRVIVQYTQGGNERAVGRVVETATGRLLDGPFLAEAVQWTPDGSGFRYRPIRDLGVRASLLQVRGGLPIRLHRLGTPFAADPVVFDPIAMGSDSGAIAWLHPTGASHVLISLQRPAHTQESEIFLATAAEAVGPEARWRRVSVAADSVVLPFVRGEWIYAASSRGAPNGRLVRTPLARPDWSTAEVVVPENGAVLWDDGVTEMRAARDAFYYIRTDSGHQRLFRVPFDGGREREVAMPFEGSMGGLVGDPDHDGVSFVFGGWAQPDHLYRYRPAAGRMELLPAFFNPPDPYGELPGLTARTVLVRSHDGVMVPLTILRGPGPQGPRPTILWGYGAYGATIDAFFRADVRPWLAAGGVYAFCHTRGGGYFGRAWREAGMMQTKPNTWKDGIACAEYLVRQGITTPARLGITGASAGGIFAGRGLTERPDLFAAAVIEVGVLDLVRFYRDGSGPANLDEYGSVETEPGFRGLLAMSTYHHVQPGARYPATLLYAGFNDARVTPWHAAKMAAALRHAGGDAALPGGERPVLLSVDFGTGHGMGSSTEQLENRWATALAFFAARLGLPVR